MAKRRTEAHPETSGVAADAVATSVPATTFICREGPMRSRAARPHDRRIASLRPERALGPAFCRGISPGQADEIHPWITEVGGVGAAALLVGRVERVVMDLKGVRAVVETRIAAGLQSSQRAGR